MQICRVYKVISRFEMVNQIVFIVIHKTYKFLNASYFLYSLTDKIDRLDILCKHVAVILILIIRLSSRRILDERI